jgi:hypothetical protein
MEIVRTMGQQHGNLDFGTHMVTMGQHRNHEDNGTATWKLGLRDTHGNSSGHRNQDNATLWKHI